MNILAIESSCDETAAAVVQDGRTCLSNVVWSQVADHAPYGGVVPEIASRKHLEAIGPVVKEAMGQFTVDAVAVTAAPGLIGALLVGVSFAKGLALSLGVPLIPVHHLRAHIAATYLENPDLEPPFLALVVSGGHTQILQVNTWTDMNVLGSTRDDAAGEVFDKIAREMGLGYPGGAALSRLALQGDPHSIALPQASLTGNPLDMSFSGVKTAANNALHNWKQKGSIGSFLPDLAASFQEAVVMAIVNRCELAQNMTGLSNVVVCGGVAANLHLREKLSERVEGRLFMPSISLCGDNGAMVGAQGYFEYLQGHVATLKLEAYATLSPQNCENALCQRI
jgi:N6-L-threonylcarbamoyladenine synthase